MARACSQRAARSAAVGAKAQPPRAPARRRAAPRRREHERKHAVGVLRQLLQYGQRERRGLAAARLRRADHVAAGEHGRDAPALHRRRRVDAEAREHAAQPVAEAQVLEGGALARFLSGAAAGGGLPQGALGQGPGAVRRRGRPLGGRRLRRIRGIALGLYAAGWALALARLEQREGLPAVEGLHGAAQGTGEGGRGRN